MDIYQKLIGDIALKTGLTPEALNNALRNTRITLADERVFLSGTSPGPVMTETIVSTVLAYPEIVGVVNNTVPAEAFISAEKVFSTPLPGWEPVPEKEMSQIRRARAGFLRAVPVRLRDPVPQ